MFTPAFHRGFSCDALVIDAESSAVPLVLDADAPETTVVDAVLERVVLMSRSLHDVRRSTFGLFCGHRDGRLLLAPAASGPATIPFQRLAARRGLAIVAPAWSHEELG